MPKDHGPWKIKSSEVKYKNPWKEVREDHVITPDGKDSIFSVVKMHSGISVLPIDDEGFVYLVEEFRYALGTYDIATVCGTIDGSEDPLATAGRELKEELGIIAKEWIPLGRMDPFTMSVIAPTWLFIARELSFTAPSPDSTEEIKVHKVTFDEAVKMVMESKITLSLAAVNILKAAKYLGKL